MNRWAVGLLSWLRRYLAVDRVAKVNVIWQVKNVNKG